MIIAIDLGGTKIAGALFDEQGNVAEKQVRLLEGQQGSEVGKEIGHILQELLSVARNQNVQVSSIGVAVPGIYHNLTGTVWAPNIPQWEDYPLLEEINSLVEDQGINVFIDSDRSCYILGEVWKGAASGCRDAIFLAVGTGIGAGILVDGRVLRGSHGVAGSIGWLAVTHPFLPEYTTYGCFEYHASGDGMARMANQILAENTQKMNVPGKGNLDQVATPDIFAAYERQDPVAVKVVHLSIEFWGKSVANLVSLFDPQVIVFGGGVFGPAVSLLNDIHQEAQKWAQPISFKKVQLKASQLGGDAGLYGAGYLALKGS